MELTEGHRIVVYDTVLGIRKAKPGLLIAFQSDYFVYAMVKLILTQNKLIFRSEILCI